MRLIEGDCLEALRELPDASVDAVVTDPPYGLGFMGKAWDDLPPGEEWGRECLRVLKPGGHLLAFGGSRTYHRLACAVEDAGFEVRDQMMWLYGSGFPKSLDVSKAIDKANGRQFEDRYALGRHIKKQRLSLGLTHKQVNEWFGYSSASQHWESQHREGARVPTMADWIVLRDRLRLSDEWLSLIEREEAEREVVGASENGIAGGTKEHAGNPDAYGFAGEFAITAPATEQAVQWNGWGTALKPAHEPIVVARKPLAGTVAENVLRFGTGALNIDGCRIGTDGGGTRCDNRDASGRCLGHGNAGRSTSGETIHGPDSFGGRWPANVVLDEEAGRLLDEQSGESTSQGGRVGKKQQASVSNVPAGKYHAGDPGFGDTGGASRFFYCAKASKGERNAGLDGFPLIKGGSMNGEETRPDRPTNHPFRQNHHPTVKPISLMRYLVRLVTPPEGTVLDPFLGSGTTGCAAVLEGFGFIGIERETEYLAIARARIEWWEKHRGDGATEEILKAAGVRDEIESSGQLGLLGEAA